MPSRIPVSVGLKDTNMSAMPVVIEVRRIIRLCGMREETALEASVEMAKPNEIRRKREPAPPWSIPKSRSTLGMMGEKITLDKKLT